jgi:hypothetical protein
MPEIPERTGHHRLRPADLGAALTSPGPLQRRRTPLLLRCDCPDCRSQLHRYGNRLSRLALGKGEQSDGDYINCPFHLKNDYLAFVEALRTAERIELRDFEKPLESGVRAGHETFFEGCLPVEIIAGRGEKALAYGPMRPVGLNDPRVPRRPYAVVQLRQDNLAGNLYNLVGFQTNLTFPNSAGFPTDSGARKS